MVKRIEVCRRTELAKALLGSRNNLFIRDLHPPINKKFHVRMNECWVTLGATHKRVMKWYSKHGRTSSQKKCSNCELLGAMFNKMTTSLNVGSRSCRAQLHHRIRCHRWQSSSWQLPHGGCIHGHGVFYWVGISRRNKIQIPFGPSDAVHD